MTISDQIMDKAKIFDRADAKVVGVLPPNIKLSEIVGVSHWPDKTSRVSVRRGETLFLCIVKTTTLSPVLLRLKEEIKHSDCEWDERWEPWELHGSTEPYEKQKMLIKSRLRNAEERESYKARYE